MKASLIKNILVNIRAFFTINIRQRLNEDTSRINQLEEIIATLDHTITVKFHYLNILSYYASHPEESNLYQKELNYLKRKGNYASFPYEPAPIKENIEYGFDEVSHLPFVIHENKKLFFKASQTPSEALDIYKKYLQTERLLDTTDDNVAPHQYQSPFVHVTAGDVVFDIGAAEGLFALDQIDKASHIVIVESSPDWIKPLQQTFAPYRDKVTIVHKFVSASDTETTISMNSLLADFNCNSLFIKMDIEGYELPAIASAEIALKRKATTKMAIASYHKQHDAEELKTLLNKLGYSSEYSNGFMLYYCYDTPTPPYFRKGIIRAKNIK